MLTCSRALSADSMAQGSAPSAPALAAAIASSVSIAPAIGAWMMGRSTFRRSSSRRSGHMAAILD